MKIGKIWFLVVVLSLIILGCSRSDFDLWKGDRFLSVSEACSFAAEKLYLSALKQNIKSNIADTIRIKLASLYIKRGAFEQAIEQLKEAASIDAKKLMAQVFLKNGDYTQALEVFNKCGEKGDDAYIFNYAIAAEKSNLFDQALRLYESIKSESGFFKEASERIKAINLISAKSKFAGVEDEIRERIESSGTQEDFPDASGLYLFMDENIELTNDGRLESDMHYCIKVLNDRGKEKFAEVSIPYDSTYEKLELEYARTIKPDGTVVTVGDKNIRDVSLYLNFPMYSNARARIISMPEVVPGACIEYKVKITRTKLANEKDFDTAYWLQADEPIIFEHFNITVPKEKNLKFKVINAEYNTLGYELEPKQTADGLKKVYSFEFENVPAIIPEPAMPSLSRIDPYVMLSTFGSWQDIYLWWRSLYKDKVVSNDEIRLKSQELVKGLKSKHDRVRAIYNYCVQEIRYVAVEYGDAGYEPHKAEEIFKNKYGDCKDKAILFISMLGSIGIDAYPVLISTFDSLEVEEDIPGLVFDHAIAAVELDNKLVFLDLTASTTPFMDLPAPDQDRLALVFFKDRYSLIRTPLASFSDNVTSTIMKIKMNQDESIECFRQIKTNGIFEQGQRFWLKYTMPALIDEELKTRARLIAPGAVLKSRDIRNVDNLNLPVYLSYNFTAPQFFKKAGKTRIMSQLGGLDSSGLSKESRKYPIEIMSLSSVDETIEVELPKHLAVKYLPKPVEVRTKWFDFINRYEVVPNNILRFYSLSSVKQRVIPIAEYADYKKSLEETEVLADQQVIIEERR